MQELRRTCIIVALGALALEMFTGDQIEALIGAAVLALVAWPTEQA